MKKQIFALLVALATSFGFAGGAHAQQADLGVSPSPTTWSWTLTGVDSGHGTFTTIGDGTDKTKILSFAGIFNGLAIGGLVPKKDDLANWMPDNKFKDRDTGRAFSSNGVLFSVPGLNINGGSNVNFYYDGRKFTVGTGTASGGYVTHRDTFSVTAVPEPETYAMFLAGIGALLFVGRRRVGQVSSS